MSYLSLFASTFLPGQLISSLALLARRVRVGSRDGYLHTVETRVTPALSSELTPAITPPFSFPGVSRRPVPSCYRRHYTTTLHPSSSPHTLNILPTTTPYPPHPPIPPLSLLRVYQTKPQPHPYAFTAVEPIDAEVRTETSEKKGDVRSYSMSDMAKRTRSAFPSGLN